MPSVILKIVDFFEVIPSRLSESRTEATVQFLITFETTLFAVFTRLVTPYCLALSALSRTLALIWLGCHLASPCLALPRLALPRLPWPCLVSCRLSRLVSLASPASPRLARPRPRPRPRPRLASPRCVGLSVCWSVVGLCVCGVCCLSVCQSVHLSVCLSAFSVCMFVCLVSLSLCLCLFVFNLLVLFCCLLLVCLFVCVRSFVCLFVCLFVRSFVRSFVCLFVVYFVSF